MTPEPHVPRPAGDRLALSLWDFSWYTRAGAGEPFADLDLAFDELVERGFNTVRICAAPLYLFGGFGLPDLLEISGFGPTPVGGYYGERTRWYDVPGGFAVDLRARLLELFAVARRHDCRVILATWEYQQSPSFAADEAWWRAIDGVPFEARLDVLANATVRLLEFLAAAGFSDEIAFVELHNEVDFSRVPGDHVSIGRAIDTVSAAFPDIPATVSYGKPPHLDMAAAPPSMQVAQFHIYSYGVLDALQQKIDLRSTGTAGFPNERLRSLFRPDAPSWDAYGKPDPWRLEATVITDQMLYGYDQVDPELWDLWLYDHYGEHREAMRADIDARLTGVAAWAARRNIPMVIGEGWVGYTPLLAHFEEGPVGKDLAELGIRRALELGAWGTQVVSNAAPHHPLWADIPWLRRMTALILED